MATSIVPEGKDGFKVTDSAGTTHLVSDGNGGYQMHGAHSGQAFPVPGGFRVQSQTGEQKVWEIPGGYNLGDQKVYKRHDGAYVGSDGGSTSSGSGLGLEGLGVIYMLVCAVLMIPSFIGFLGSWFVAGMLVFFIPNIWFSAFIHIIITGVYTLIGALVYKKYVHKHGCLYKLISIILIISFIISPVFSFASTVALIMEVNPQLKEQIERILGSEKYPLIVHVSNNSSSDLPTGRFLLYAPPC